MKNYRSREESKVPSFFVFSHKQKLLEPSAGRARNRRKATVKIRSNPSLQILPLIPNFFCYFKTRLSGNLPDFRN